MSPAQMALLHGRCFVTPRPWSADEFSAFLTDAHCCCLCQTDALLIGRTIAGEAELLTLAVAPEARRQGRARALLMRWHDAARALGARESFLEVASDNVSARALYQTSGYEICGRRKAYYRRPDGKTLDALVFRCDLT